MQTSVSALAISAVAQSGKATGANGINTASNQLVVYDQRLRTWVKTVSGGAWAAPTTNYTLVGSASGDVIKKSGVTWSGGYQDLGTQTAVVLPDGNTDTCYISSVALSANEDLIVWYSNGLRGMAYEAGIYAQRVWDDGAGHLYWSDPQTIYQSVWTDDINAQSQEFITFPRVQTINGEYWVLAFHVSQQALVITYHLCYMRGIMGTDGQLKWSHPQYLAGVSGDTSQTTVGMNQYSNSGIPTAFTRDNLKHAYLSVSGNSTYIIGKDGNNFTCPSNTIVGVDNSAMKVDITADVKSRKFPQPPAPTASQANYDLQNTDKNYNTTTSFPDGVIVPGSKIIHQAGYGSNLITVETTYIDEIRPKTTLDGTYTNDLTITTNDQLPLRMKFDTPFEFNSPRQSINDIFCNLTSFVEITGEGNFLIDENSNLVVKALNPNSPMPDYVAYVNEIRTINGTMEARFRFIQSKTDHWGGIVLQGSANGQNYWAVRYNGDTSKFELVQATTLTDQYSYITYGAAVASSGVISLTLATWYWLKVEQYQNHVMAWYSTDRINWTNVIDYTGISANLGFWGVCGKATGIMSDPLGNTSGYGDAITLDDGANNPIFVGVRIQTGAYPSNLYALAAMFGQTNTPPDALLMLVADNGSGTAPADATDSSNVLWKGYVPTSSMGSPTAPSWTQISPSQPVALTASTYYWVVVSFKSALSGQTMKWFSIDPANNTYGIDLTKQSTDSATWTSLSNTAQCLTACAVVEYDYGHPEFNALYWSSGEQPNTVESLLADAAAKARAIPATVDSFLANADLTLDPDGILWQPTSYGKFGDFVFDTDADITGSTAEIVFRQSAISGGATNGYRLVVDKANQLIKFYSSAATLVHTAGTMIYIPQTCHIRLVNWQAFVYVYINQCLAGLIYDSNLTTDGYFGLVNSGTTWTNSRIPDMTPIKMYYNMDANKTVANVFDDLLAKTRYKWFVNYDGSIRAGSFPRKTSVATYQATLKNAQGATTIRYTLSAVQPQGNYSSKRYDAVALDNFQGFVLFEQVDDTNAVTNQDAYADGALVLQRAKEQTEGYEFTLMPMDFALQREDRITVVNTEDGVSRDMIVDSIEPTIVLGNATSEGEIGCRKYV